MALGNYTIFLPKHVTGIQFGGTVLTEAQMNHVTESLDASYTTNNASDLINLSSTADAVNPTIKYAFAKDINTSGNERNTSAEGLLGSLDGVTQNTEKIVDFNTLMIVEMTVVYRNPMVTAIFNDSTKVCLMTMNNAESSDTGVLHMLFNNIHVVHVGSLSRGNTGMMEQKVKFSIRGGLAGSAITCVDGTLTYKRYRVGLDYAEEILTDDSS